MEKHTQGPLDLWHPGNDHVLVGGPHGHRASVATVERMSDADRLRGVWNACEGIPTDHLQPGAVKALVEALHMALAAMGTCHNRIEQRGIRQEFDTASISNSASSIMVALIPFAEGGTTHDGESR